MRNLWIKTGCFLTGYNYGIIKNSSEASTKTVKKYLAALIIITTIWAFVGYAFAQRYLHGSLFTCIAASVIMVIIVIQIERQIILTVGKNRKALWFRIIIGVIMAAIGSVIMDQIIYKDDIEKTKVSNIQEEVSKLLPIKTQELNNQIQSLNNDLQKKENERTAIIADISKNPRLSMPSTSISYQKDSTGKMVTAGRTVTSNSIPNPKAELIPQIDEQIKYLQQQVNEKENGKLNAQTDLERELGSKTGFLDELKILFSILFSSWIALTVWILLFLFFVSIELFITVSKFGESENDYDKIIIHQKDIRIKMINQLAEQESVKHISR